MKKGDSRGRAMLRELPSEVRSIVTRANMFLRLRMSLENVWTAEKKYGHSSLPEKHALVKRALNDVRELRDEDGKPLKHIALGFKMLNEDKSEELRQNVFDLVCELHSVVMILMPFLALDWSTAVAQPGEEGGQDCGGRCIWPEESPCQLQGFGGSVSPQVQCAGQARHSKLCV